MILKNKKSSYHQIIKKDGFVFYIDNFIDKQTADSYFKILINELAWQQESIVIFGKALKTPRLSAWYGEKSYTYSGLKHPPQKYTSTLMLIKNRISEALDININGILANYYRDGFDNMGWHSDDESSLGLCPIITSLSLGETRKIQFRHKLDPDIKCEQLLEHGSLLIMKDNTQTYWKHRIPKAQHIHLPRINLTFRTIL